MKSIALVIMYAVLVADYNYWEFKTSGKKKHPVNAMFIAITFASFWVSLLL